MKDEDMNNQTLAPIGDDSDTSTICDPGVGFSGSFNAGGHKIAGYDIADGSGVVYGPATIFGCVVTTTNITGIANLSPLSVADICGDLTTARTATPLLAYRETASATAYSRLICHPTELSSTTAYIRTASGLSDTYLLVRDINPRYFYADRYSYADSNCLYGYL